MLRTTAIASAVVALVVGVAGATTASAKSKNATDGTCAGQYVVPVDAATRLRASNAVLCLVNRERVARGAGPLRAAGLLTEAATAHSADMVANKFISHFGRNGDGAIQRVERTGYKWLAVGETIAWGKGRGATAFKLVSTFLKSAEHRPIMLGRHYREVGLGLVLGAPRGNAPSAATLTLDFGSR